MARKGFSLLELSEETLVQTLQPNSLELDVFLATVVAVKIEALISWLSKLLKHILEGKLGGIGKSASLALLITAEEARLHVSSQVLDP